MYKEAKINLTKTQVSKALKGKPIRVHNTQLNSGSNIILLHPTNYKLIEQSIKKGKGLTLYLAPGEMMATASYNKVVPNVNLNDIEGSGIFDSIWQGIKKVGSFLKDTGLATPLADIAQSVAAPVLGENVTKGIREGLRAATGIGAMPKKKTSKAKGKGLYISKPAGNGLYL